MQADKQREYLQKHEDGRYSIDGRVLSCGDVIQMRFQFAWHKVQIEHSDRRGGYYGIRLSDQHIIELEQDQSAKF